MPSPTSALGGATVFPPLGVPQGLSPSGIATTKDGQYAYIVCGGSEIVYRVRLADLMVVGYSDLSLYFPLEAGRVPAAVLDRGENRLLIYSYSWRRLIVLDAGTLAVARTVDDIDIIGMFLSQHTGQLVTWDGGGVVRFWDTETFAVTEHRGDGLFFLRIRESRTDPTVWYVVFATAPGSQLGSFGVFNHVTGAMQGVVPLARQHPEEYPIDLCVLPHERKAYIGTFGGWYATGFRGFGWLHTVDLAASSSAVQPVDGGAFQLAASPDSRTLYVGSGSPVPNTNNLLVVDTSSNAVTGRVNLGVQPYGWPFTQVNDIALHPGDPNVLLVTTADGNSFSKARADGSTLADTLVFNRETRRPHHFARKTNDDSGLVLLTLTDKALDLDLTHAVVRRAVRLPRIYDNTGTYDVAFTRSGRLLVTQNEYVLELDATDLRQIAKHPLPIEARMWHFALSRDETRLYAVTYDPQGQLPNVFVAISTADYRVLSRIVLPGGAFNFWPFELPGGSKLYIAGGEPGGAVTVHVIGADDLAVRKTITFDEPGLRGISGGPYFPFTYDASSHRLFVGATEVILAIDTETDTISDVIHLRDLASAVGVGILTTVNAVGLIYLPAANQLVIAHLDGGFLSTYDLTSKRFLPRVASLRGFFPSYVFANQSQTKLFSLNTRSDSISVVDLATMTVEKVIDIEPFLTPRTPRRHLH
jgi:DNA-binding beta-propeller fold protein YncE